ncbi:MAG: hypothetical protein ACREHG_01075, partial [Candidatus Saccharimonadales bacterium]
FNQLPHSVAREVMAVWLRSKAVSDFNKSILENLTAVAKAGHPGRRYPALNNWYMRIDKEYLALEYKER